MRDEGGGMKEEGGRYVPSEVEGIEATGLRRFLG